MARPLRVQYPGAVYHVMSRGNDRRAIVRDDEDRFERIERFRQVALRFSWQVFAYVVMTNHDHLFFRTLLANLAAGMQSLNGGYAQWFNRRHRRVGHLFQARYAGHLVEEEGYFRNVSRYIHLNPVRAGMVEWPEQYRWSSYPGYHWSRRADSWVDYPTVLGEFGTVLRSARASYRAFVRDGIDTPPASPLENAAGNFIVGSDAFVERITAMITPDRAMDADVPQQHALRHRPSLTAIVTVTCDVLGESPSKMRTSRRYVGHARLLAAWIASRQYGYRGRDIAAAIGCSRTAGISHLLRRAEAKFDHPEGRTLRRQLQRIESALSRVYS